MCRFPLHGSDIQLKITRCSFGSVPLGRNVAPPAANRMFPCFVSRRGRKTHRRGVPRIDAALWLCSVSRTKSNTASSPSQAHHHHTPTNTDKTKRHTHHAPPPVGGCQPPTHTKQIRCTSPSLLATTYSITLPSTATEGWHPQARGTTESGPAHPPAGPAAASRGFCRLAPRPGVA